MGPLHEKARIMDTKAVDRAIQRIGSEIVEHNRGTENVVLIGIQRRGVPLARSIAEHIKTIEGGKVPTGTLDVTFYRDDLTFLKEREGEEREMAETDIPFSVTGRDVILVDDVLFTGRTVRAAMEALIESSSPCSSTGGTGSSPSTQTTWARTSPPLTWSSSPCGCRGTTAGRTASCFWRRREGKPGFREEAHLCPGGT